MDPQQLNVYRAEIVRLLAAIDANRAAHAVAANERQIRINQSNMPGISSETAAASREAARVYQREMERLDRELEALRAQLADAERQADLLDAAAADAIASGASEESAYLEAAARLQSQEGQRRVMFAGLLVLIFVVLVVVAKKYFPAKAFGWTIALGGLATAGGIFAILRKGGGVDVSLTNDNAANNLDRARA